MKHAAWWGSVPFTVGLVLATSVAGAAEEQREKEPTPFGSRGSWGVLLEQLAGVSYHRVSFPGPQGSDTVAQKSVQAEAFRPDVAVDGFVTDHLSLGARVLYQGMSGTLPGPPDATQDMHVVQVFPRVGFAYSWPSRLGIWAQASLGGGSVWSSQSTSTATGTVASHYQSGTLAGGLTLLGTYTPAPHVVLTAGPWLVTDLARFGDPYMKDTTPVGASVGAGFYL